MLVDKPPGTECATYVFRRREADVQRPTKRDVAAGVAEDDVADQVAGVVSDEVVDGRVKVFDRSSNKQSVYSIIWSR